MEHNCGFKEGNNIRTDVRPRTLPARYSTFRGTQPQKRIRE